MKYQATIELANPEALGKLVAYATSQTGMALKAATDIAPVNGTGITRIGYTQNKKKVFLTVTQVNDMLRRSKNGMTKADLAKEFNVVQSCVQNVIDGRHHFQRKNLANRPA